MKLVLWALLLVVISCPFAASAQQLNTRTATDSSAAYISCGPFLNSDIVKPIASLNELPDYVRYKLDAHLKRRLSPASYAQLHFIEGKQLDLENLLGQRNDYQWTVRSYYLCFAFRHPAIGKNEYMAAIGLDKWGQAIDDITLPETDGHPEKEHIIPRATALQIAMRKGTVRKKTRPEDVHFKVGYSPELEILTWIITVTQRKADFATDIRKIILNAHNGEVLRIRKYESRSNF